MNGLIDDKRYTAYLQKSKLFHGIAPDAIRSLLPHLHLFLKHYRKGDIVAVEGAPSPRIAVVVSGEYSVYKLPGESGALMRISKPGDTLGAREYYSEEQRWFYTHTCMMEGELLWFSPEYILSDFYGPDAVQRNLVFRDNMMRMVSDSLIDLFSYAEIISTNPVYKRIMVYLRMMSVQQKTDHVVLEMNRGQLASYLAVERSTLSRELHRLERDGKLILEGDSTYILTVDD